MLRAIAIAALVATATAAHFRGTGGIASTLDPARRALSETCPQTCGGYTCDHQAVFLESTCAALEADLGCDCAGCGCGCAYDEVHHQGECLPLCDVGLGYSADGSTCGECLPGQYLQRGMCAVCSTGYSDAPGATACEACPSNTATRPSNEADDHDSRDDCRHSEACSAQVLLVDTINKRHAEEMIEDRLGARWWFTGPSGRVIASGDMPLFPLNAEDLRM